MRYLLLVGLVFLLITVVSLMVVKYFVFEDPNDRAMFILIVGFFIMIGGTAFYANKR